MLRVYAEWSVLRQARRRAARTRFAPASTARVRQTIRRAAAFLTWLNDQDLRLADLTQVDVDRWLHEHPGRLQLRNFLRWAHHRNLTIDHEVPDRPRDDPHPWWDKADHWAHLQRCLQDETLPRWTSGRRAPQCCSMGHRSPASRNSLLPPSPAATSRIWSLARSPPRCRLLPVASCVGKQTKPSPTRPSAALFAACRVDVDARIRGIRKQFFAK